VTATAAPAPATSAPTLKWVGALLLLAAIYVAVGKLGLRLAFSYPSATPVWPATGLALAAFLLFGRRVWPAIFLGAFIVNYTTAGTIATSALIAIGNTLEGVVGAWLVTRFAGGSEAFEHPETIFRFTLLGAVLATMISATIGVTALRLGDLAPPAMLSDIWLTWWLGDATGALIVTPVLVAWWTAPKVRPPTQGALEMLAAGAGLFVSGLIVFGGLLDIIPPRIPTGFLSIPFLIWIAFRLGRREAASGVLLLSAVAIWGTLNGHGPFIRPTPNASLILLQGYMATIGVTMLILAAAAADRRDAEERLRELSISDPLTGIANYRHLIERLNAEIGRARRNKRSFALLFFDVDGLKAINDQHGHLVGSRALVRVAEALKSSARTMDTPARYGGDEFALLLPEASEEDAAVVVRRITERLAEDPEQPKVSVSLGVSEHPRDGATAESLIGVADQRLYAARATERRNGPQMGPRGA
jgi:diguanylate cyclase (GGDEF)-like protein